jgi:hypothetical protein
VFWAGGPKFTRVCHDFFLTLLFSAFYFQVVPAVGGS